MKILLKRTYTIYFLYILLLWANSTIGLADSNSSHGLLSENEFFDDIPSVATVTRLPTPKAETPAAVTIIDQDMIRATGARELADLFRLVPGFQVSLPQGHVSAVTYHGLGDQYSRRMQILIDGRSTYGSLFGHVSWSTQGIAIEDIERIEVVRGPNSVSYGANAFLGTINIITKHTSQQTGKTVKVSRGNNGIIDGLARYSTAISNGNMRITGAYKSDNGLEESYDDNRIRMVNLRADLQANTTDKILFQTSFSNTDHGEGREGNSFFPAVTANTQAHYQQLRWQRHFSESNQLSLQFYHNFRNLDFDYLTEPVNLGPIIGVVQLPVDFDGVSTRYDFELQHTLSKWNNLRLVWGLGNRYDKVESDAYFANEGSATTRSSRLFSNIEWKASKAIIVNAGGMWESTEFVGTDFSPRLAFNYALNDKQTLRTVWSQAKRIPSLFEEKGNFRFEFQNIVLDQTFANQGNLKAETITSYELGYFGQFPEAKTTLDVRVYRDRIEDLIGIEAVTAADLDNIAGSYSNEGKITIDGIDFEVRYRPTRKTQLAMTHAFMKASATDIDDNFLASKQLREDSVPDYSGGLFLMHELKNEWEASTGFYWVDSMRWLDSTNTADEYQRLDLRIEKKIRLNKTHGAVSLTAQNIDGDYSDYNDNRFFDRRVFLSLNVNY